MKRSFHWRVYLTLVTLYFLGNLAGFPLLLTTDVAIEPARFWAVATLVSALMIGISLAMASRSGLGAPLLEGRLSGEDRPAWLRSGLALTTLMVVACSPLSLLASLGAELDTYPFGWELLPASFKAGVVEEIASRLFLVSLFVWLGGFVRRDVEGRPARSVYWAAILLAGLIFGWAHVDARLSDPAATFWDYALIMVLNSLLGVSFDWLCWKLGLEWAMFAHFAFDAFVSIIFIPVYLLNNPLTWAILIMGMVVASVLSLRSLVPV